MGNQPLTIITRNQNETMAEGKVFKCVRLRSVDDVDIPTRNTFTIKIKILKINDFIVRVYSEFERFHIKKKKIVKLKLLCVLKIKNNNIFKSYLSTFVNIFF